MRLFGFEFSRAKTAPELPPWREEDLRRSLLAPPESGRWLTIYDQYTGAFQDDVSMEQSSVARQSAVFRAVALISGDIAKLCLDLVQLKQGVWIPATNPAYTPVLRKPNSFQTRLEFLRFWVVSLLLSGKTFVLKQFDARGVVVKLTVLDPNSVTPLIGEQGDVYYRLTGSDNLAGVPQSEYTLPAKYIIHDKYICLNHPLIGNSPLQVAGAPAMASSKIVGYNANFFTNQARPGGYIEAPEGVSPQQAEEIRTAWNSYTGTNAGKLAVLEAGLTFKPLQLNPVDAQMIDVLRFNQEDIARAFGLPAWKLGAGPMPTAANAEVLERRYFQETLQVIMEQIELLMDDALGLTANTELGVAFDEKGLLRLDNAARVKFWGEGVSRGIFSPDEARADFGMLPVEGGDTPYMQQQNYSLAALAKRDAMDDPFAKGGGTEPQAGASASDTTDGGEDKPAADEPSTLEYRGVWSETESYARGNFVTHRGSMWHCNESCAGIAPGTDAERWTLAVKRGAKGR